MSYLLPSELIEEILSRVPTTTLSRWRCTCQRWNNLFKDQRFTKKHFVNAPEQFSVLMLDQHKVFSSSLNLHGIDQNNNISAPFIGFKELSLKDSNSSSEQVDIHCVFHCGGLLLSTTTKDRLVVWNPCTGESRYIISSNRYYKYSMYALGYENNKSCRSYKILRYRSNHGTDHPPVVEFEIYDFSSGSWRFLEVTAKFLIVSRGVSLKGNTYWLADGDCLLSFEFKAERLGRLRLPFQKFSYGANVSISTVGDEKLSLLRQYDTFEMEIWVTTNDMIDQTITLSWRKFLAIDLSKWSIRHKFSSCASFFIDEEKKVVVCCDSGGQYNYNMSNMVCVIGECGVYREFQFGAREIIEKYGTAKIYSYVPSLLQIQ